MANASCFTSVSYLKPGDIVVMDDLGSHKADAIRATIKITGARLLFLPPYSPDVIPIEQVFSKFKHTLRNTMGRSVEAVEEAIAKILPTISKQECQNYLASAGYAPAQIDHALVKLFCN
jgi:putative transposase